jgi:hypothetical protein
MANTVKQIIKIVEDHEQKLRKSGTILIPKELNLSKKSLKDFLLDFLYHNHMSRYDTGNTADFPYTISGDINGNPISQTSQCYAGARRSIGDLFQLALSHYNKDTSLMEVMETMMDIVNGESPISAKNGRYTYFMYVSTCGGVHRKVFNAGTKQAKYNFTRESNDYGTPTSSNYDEFPICIQDYLTLKESGTFESYRKEKEKSRTGTKSIDDSELDKLIKLKMAELLLDNDKADYIKPIKRKKAA